MMDLSHIFAALADSRHLAAPEGAERGRADFQRSAGRFPPNLLEQRAGQARRLSRDAPGGFRESLVPANLD